MSVCQGYKYSYKWNTIYLIKIKSSTLCKHKTPFKKRTNRFLQEAPLRVANLRFYVHRNFSREQLFGGRYERYNFGYFLVSHNQFLWAWQVYSILIWRTWILVASIYCCLVYLISMPNDVLPRRRFHTHYTF